VKQLAPETVVIENVPGMKWMNQGQILQTVLDMLGELGYQSSVLDLRSEEYCVPQRRRRVFVLSKRNGESVSSPQGVLAQIVRGKTRKDARPGSEDIPPPVSVSEALSDLPLLSSGEGNDRIEYDSKWTETDYQRMMRGHMNLSEFVLKRAEQG